MEYEQRSIALLNERLPKIDKLITLLEDKSSALSSYRQSLITRAVTKGLDPNVEMKASGVQWIGNMPSHWRICRVKTCFLLFVEQHLRQIRNIGMGILIGLVPLIWMKSEMFLVENGLLRGKDMSLAELLLCRREV